MFRKPIFSICYFVLSMAAALVPADAQINVLHVSNADDFDYFQLIESRFPGSSWTSKPTGLAGNDTIGGDLDRTADFSGDSGVEGVSLRNYMETFDLIIVDLPTTSGNFVDGVNGADWAALSTPVLFNASFVARSLGGRSGMFGGDGVATPTLTEPEESVRVSTSLLSDAIMEGVLLETDLYGSFQTDTISSLIPIGGGEAITTIGDGLNTFHGVVFWPAGVTNGGGLTLAGSRAYLPLKGSPTDLTPDGQLVLLNLIDELLVSNAPVFLPPSGLTANGRIGEVALAWTPTAGATSYNIKRSLTPDAGYVTISAPGSVTGTTFTDSGLTNGTTYYYVVSAAGAVESADSAAASATPVSFIQPGINILYVANGTSPSWQNYATTGQWGNNTFIHKGIDLFANDSIGGDLDRVVDFTGTNGGAGLSVRAYLESFDLIVIGIPTTSANFIDDVNGEDWASLTRPVLFQAAVVARALDGRPGLFSGDNFITFLHGDPDDTLRASNSPLSDAILAGTGTVTDFYSFSQSDTIDGLASAGGGEVITWLTDGVVNHYGIVFWAADSVSGAGFPLAANRAFFPLKGGFEDLTPAGLTALGNLMVQLQLPQVISGGYPGWASLQITGRNPEAPAAFEADADGDGFPNGLEWSMGGDPLDGVPDPALTVAVAGDGALTLVLSRDAAAQPFHTLMVEFSTDMDFAEAGSVVIGNMNTPSDGIQPEVLVNTPAAGQVTVRLPAALAEGGRLFARLRAALLP